MQALGIPAATDRHALYREPLAGPADPNRREDRELELCEKAIVLALEDDAPLKRERESYLLDIQNPCWIWRDVPLEFLQAVSASVGQLPFNFEIGKAINDVVVEQPATEAGELRVRLGCDGPVVADLSLAPAAGRHGATVLESSPVTLPADAGQQGDLCFNFTRRDVAPIWAIDWVELERNQP